MKMTSIFFKWKGLKYYYIEKDINIIINEKDFNIFKMKRTSMYIYENDMNILFN